MEFLTDASSEILRLAFGLAVVALLVWICGRMPRTYVSLKIAGLAAWGLLSFGIPPFVFLAIYAPAAQYVLGTAAVAAGLVCMVWPFLVFGWPALRDALRKGAVNRP